MKQNPNNDRQTGTTKISGHTHVKKSNNWQANEAQKTQPKTQIKRQVGGIRSSQHQEYKPTILKEQMIGDSLDQEIRQVDSKLFDSRTMGQQQSLRQQYTDPNLDQLSISKTNTPANARSSNMNGGINQSDLSQMNARRKRPDDNLGVMIDDSEFYRSVNQVDNTKDTLVEQNIKGVLERHMELHPDHKPCKVPPQLYEKIPMPQEGIYKKDFKPQDLNLSRPHYGDANNPWDAFVAQNPPAEGNTVYRKDFVPKNLKNTGEPEIRDVVSSIQDFAKHLRAPKTNDTMYKVIPN